MINVITASNVVRIKPTIRTVHSATISEAANTLTVDSTKKPDKNFSIRKTLFARLVKRNNPEEESRFEVASIAILNSV